MAGLLTNAHFQRLEALRRVRHVLQGEAGLISFLRRDATNKLVEMFSVDQGWVFLDRDKDGDRLPSGVRFELQVAEMSIGLDTAEQARAIQHGSQRFKIVDRFEPENLARFWRFWVADLEKVQ
jgi:hypothetical protein